MDRILLFALLLMVSCSQAPEQAQAVSGAVTSTVKEVLISEGTPQNTADLAISGMSCEMMCGGSIKKALAKLPGVSGAEITFVEGDVLDHAVVTYDPALITEQQLVSTVQALHDGQYKVLTIDITKQVKSASTGAVRPATVETEEVASTSIVGSGASGLVGLLYHLLRP